MGKEHAFVRLAKAQKAQGSLLNVGLDIHPFGSFIANMNIYGSAIPEIKTLGHDYFMDSYKTYKIMAMFCGMDEKTQEDYARMLAAIEVYVKRVVKVSIEKAGIYSFKPQSAFFEQFGFPGMYLLMQIRNYIRELGEKNSVDTICILDCKRGDIFTTQSAYFRAFLGNLQGEWGINFSPFDFDIINVTPWMGSDVMALQDKGEPALGLKLMREGKGIIGVNKTSNPSGPDYQEVISQAHGNTVQMMHAKDSYKWTQDFELEQDGLSTIGLVVGATHECDGSIRKAFPSTTLLVPGFGAQGGAFSLVMKELISGDHPWNGQGAIFSSSRGLMYPWMSKYGGSGSESNFENDFLSAVTVFKKAEEKAFDAAWKAGIRYPFS